VGWSRRRWGGWFGSARAAGAGAGEGGEGSGGGSFGHGQLLETKVVAHLEEGRERGAAAKMKTKGAEALIEPTDDVEDERLLGDRLAEVPKIFRHAFEAAAVVDDGEIALGKGPELLVGVESSGGTVPKELGLDGEPDRTSGGAALGDRVGEIVGDGAEQPGADDTIHPHPGRRSRGDGVGENIAFQRVLSEDVKEGLLPAGVEGGVDIQEQRDESPDVLDRDSLRMEIEEDGGLLLEKSGLEVDVVFAMVEGVGVIFLGGRGRGTFGSSALLRGTETSSGGIEIGLSEGGLPLSFLGAGQSSSSCCLGCACFLVACSVSVGSRFGGQQRKEKT